MSFTLLGAGRGTGTGGGGSSFSSPLDLTGLIGWWDASVSASIHTSGSSVNTWDDQSGLGNTMTWTGFGHPTYSATGFNTSFPAVSVDAVHVGSALSASSIPMGTGNTLTFWWVGNFDGANANTDARLLSYIGSGAGTDFNDVRSWSLNVGTTDFMTVSRDAANVASVQQACTWATDHRIIGTINSSGVQTLYIDGVTHTLATAPGNFSSSGTLAIGRNAAGGNYSAGPTAECGVATGFTNSTDVAAFDTYLKNKWGL